MIDHMIKYFYFYLFGLMVLIAVLGTLATEIQSARRNRIQERLTPWLAKERAVLNELDEIAENENMSQEDEAIRLSALMRNLENIRAKIREIESNNASPN